MIASIEPKDMYIREMDGKLMEWDSKLRHVKEKAGRTDTESTWLEHALQRLDDVKQLVDALRDKDESQFESVKPRIAIKAEELETAMVRVAERFQESSELGLDPGSRKAQPRAGEGERHRA